MSMNEQDEDKTHARRVALVRVMPVDALRTALERIAGYSPALFDDVTRDLGSESVEHGGEDLSGKLASSGNGDRR